MKQDSESTLRTISTEEEIESVEKKIVETGYPDISKANTKITVIGSFIVIIILFLLSVLFPTPSATNPTTEGQAINTTDNDI